MCNFIIFQISKFNVKICYFYFLKFLEIYGYLCNLELKFVCLQKYEEFLKFNGLKKIFFKNEGCLSYFFVNNLVVFDFVDWRIKGYVIDVKDQVIIVVYLINIINF